MVTYAMQARPYSQYEASSGSLDLSQRYNCGPTCATFWGSYMRGGTYLYIESTRTGAGIPRGRSTTFDEQRRMFIYRGIGASVRQITSLAALDSLIGDGRRPIIMPILMSRVSASVRGHAFLGWHSVAIVQKSGDGYWIMDPNFPPGDARLKRFYPRGVLAWALFGTGATTCWAIVAYDPKPLPPPSAPSTPTYRGKIQVNSNVDYVNLRATPSFSGAIIGSARGPLAAAGSGIYRGTVRAFPLNSTFHYVGSDSANEWRKMADYANRYYWIKREFTHLVT